MQLGMVQVHGLGGFRLQWLWEMLTRALDGDCFWCICEEPVLRQPTAVLRAWYETCFSARDRAQPSSGNALAFVRAFFSLKSTVRMGSAR